MFVKNFPLSERERVLWETADIAAAEEKALIDGTLLVRTPGGSSQQPLFFYPKESKEANSNQNPQGDDDELVWFFDVPFTTMEKGLENIGEDEMEALENILV